MAFPTATVTPGTGLTINTLPNAGQNTAANSLGVVLASDQPAVPVSGTVAISGTVPTSLAALPALATGANAIGSITNTGFAINGTLPAFAAAPTVNIGTAPAIVLGAGAAAVGTVSVTGTVATNSTIVAAIPAGANAIGTVGVTALPALPAGANIIGSVLVPETTFFNDTTTVLTASTTFTGTTRDVGIAAGTATPSTYFNAFFFADQAGTASVECSNDNTTWRTIATSSLAINTPLLLSVPVMTRYHRVKLVNGATLQTAVMVNSSYSGS